jgi:hypothetical protein
MFKKMILGLALLAVLVITPLAMGAFSGDAIPSAPCACCGAACSCEDCACDANGCACDTGGSCACDTNCCSTCCAD